VPLSKLFTLEPTDSLGFLIICVRLQENVPTPLSQGHITQSSIICLGDLTPKATLKNTWDPSSFSLFWFNTLPGPYCP